MTSRAPLPTAALGGVLVAALVACRAVAPAPVPIESDDGRFPHARHTAVSCTDCHPLGAILAGRIIRPGADDHAPCDRGGCHRAEFLATPGPLCVVCHATVDPAVAGNTTPAPYPPVRGRRALAAEFSHQDHLDRTSLERAVGFHVACGDCHVDADGRVRPADHAVCGRCHAPEAAPPGAPPMTACDSCHLARPRDPGRARRFIVGDLQFAHDRHQVDRRGAAIRCAECHIDSAQAARTGEHPRPTTAACVSCHDDTDRAPVERRLRVCETCHTEKRASIGALAPRSHLPELERPEDHTGAFRRDHAGDARLRAARCARCHTMMSGSSRDACDECHQVMAPADHVVTWREFDHGPAAAARADRCATCHQGDFCASCHAVAPRSHLPLSAFAAGGHAGPARMNLRACLACHAPPADCDPCHAGARP